jgi:hypothetical protein
MSLSSQRVPSVRRAATLILEEERVTLVDFLRLAAGWLRGGGEGEAIPSYLREDLGLPPEELPRDWRDLPSHPIDPSLCYRWRK